MNDEPLNDTVASAVVDAICDALEGAPRTGLGKSLVTDALIRMCATKEQAWWIARRVTELYTRWGACGVPGLRQILCSKYHPRDGIESKPTEAFPEGIPSEQAPLQLQLPDGKPDPQLEADIKRLAEGKKLRKPDGNIPN